MRDHLCQLFLDNGAFHYVHLLDEKPHDGQHKSYTTHDYELFYLVSGSVTYQVEDRRYSLQAGDILLLNNREMHRPFFSSGEPYERIIIFFSPEFCSHYRRSGCDLLQYFEKRRPGTHNLLSRDQYDHERVYQLFLEMEQQIHLNRPDSPVLTELAFIRVLLHCHERLGALQEGQAYPYSPRQKMEHIIDFINQNYSRPLSLDEISRTFFIDKYHFSHQFRQVTGFSFREYIQKKRVYRGTELLRLGYKPSEASRICGFEDYAGFYRAFRKIHGVNPAAFTET